MSNQVDPEKKIGAIEWRDLSVEDAGSMKDFYCEVVGWESSPVSMGDYDDYNICNPGSTDAVAGICHKRGTNKAMPSQWLMYVRVANVADSAERCRDLGGTVLDGPRIMGSIQFCVIRDPQGAVLALISD